MNDLNNLVPSLKGKKVLIIGGLGFIGSNLAHTCLTAGAEITIFDCLDPRSGGNIYNINSIQSSIEFLPNNILDFNIVAKAIIDKDIIFNCAASTSHPFSMREPWIDMDVNSKGVINLLEAIRRFNKDVKFIHIGTSTQIGKLQYSPADENHPEYPMDIYSANKGVSEKYVLIYANAYNLRATVVRLPNVYGPRACIHSPEFTFNNFFIGLALQNKSITVFGSGEQKRNILYVQDAVNALIQASLSESVNADTLFAVGDNHYSILEIAEITAKHLSKSDVKSVPWPKGRKEVDVGDAIFSNKKIKKLLNWEPQFSFSAGLTETGNYFNHCLKHYTK